jgi:hypothetical protein
MMVELRVLGVAGRGEFEFLKREGKVYYMTERLNNEESYNFFLLETSQSQHWSVLVSKHD